MNLVFDFYYKNSKIFFDENFNALMPSKAYYRGE